MADDGGGATGAAVAPSQSTVARDLVPVTAVVITRNEAANLPQCLAALSGFGQVIVVDSGSTDGTPDLAAAKGATVVHYRWNGAYPKKKQWCLENLAFAYDWVLMVDADEIITQALAEEISIATSTGNAAGYFIDGRYVFLGRPLRFGLRNRKLCLFNRHRVHYPPCPDLAVATMWEVEGHYQPVIDGPVGGLRNFLWHADQKPFYAWIERHNRYSDWEAQLLADADGVHRLFSHESWPRRTAKAIFRALPGRALFAFLHSYVWRLGLLDGATGLHFALARAFYYWQVAVKRREWEERQRLRPP